MDRLGQYLKKPQVIEQVQKLSFLVGFDGFIDDISHVVKKRHDPFRYEVMSNMKEFADRILQAQGKSANIELALQQRRPGGNGPILASALLQTEAEVSLIGALGYPDIDPLFVPLSQACTECVSIANPGHTDAIEFRDGKLLLGKHGSVLTIDERLIIERIGKERLISLLEQSHLFASANWTMIFGMTPFWKILEHELLPAAKKKPEWMFVDLADPAKRSDVDLREALVTLEALQKQLKVVLGLNVAEAERVAKVFECTPTSRSLRNALGLEQVVIHAIETAEASTKENSIQVQGPHVEKPLITTGGGDNFNAGYCLALCLGLDLEEALTMATYTSGYYVQYAKSPTLAELSKYIINHGDHRESSREQQKIKRKDAKTQRVSQEEK